MESQTWFLQPPGGYSPSQVYSFSIESEELTTSFNLAVFRDDLRCFVILAAIPDPFSVAIHCECVLEQALNETFKTNFVDWTRERVVLGATSWLVRRENPEWRAIRRIQVTDQGSVRKLGWLPPEIAEPILAALEDSVPSPTIFDFADEEV